MNHEVHEEKKEHGEQQRTKRGPCCSSLFVTFVRFVVRETLEDFSQFAYIFTLSKVGR